MVIAEQGGIYFDTDVELIRPIDGLLTNPAFFGFEDSEHVNTGLGFGAEPGNPAVQAMLREYGDLYLSGIPVPGIGLSDYEFSSSGVNTDYVGIRAGRTGTDYERIPDSR